MKTKPLPKSNIETFDYSFSVAVGCSNGCPYCYAKGIAHRFAKYWGREDMPFSKITYHSQMINRLYNSPNDKTYFVAPLSDLYCKGFSPKVRLAIYRAMRDNPNKKFYLQTKSPENIPEDEVDSIPLNCVMGVSVINEYDFNRVAGLVLKFRNTNHKIYISFEPLLGWPIPDVLSPGTPIYTWTYIKQRTEWIIVGPQTNPIIQPEYKWIKEIWKLSKEWKIPYWEKSKLVVPGRELIQQKPEF